MSGVVIHDDERKGRRLLRRQFSLGSQRWMDLSRQEGHQGHFCRFLLDLVVHQIIYD